MKTTLRIMTGIIGALLLAAGVLALPGQASPAPAKVPAASTLFDARSDFDGDGNADVLARDSHGALWLYPGNGYGGFRDRRRIGTEWNAMTAIITGHYTPGRHNDIVARDRNGRLWLYAGTGHATFKPRVMIGNGWNAFTVIQDYGFNFRYPNSGVLVRDRSGALWRYRFDTTTAHFFQRPAKIGTGWNYYDQILSVGDWNGDGDYGDLIARDRNGNLWLYALDPYGSFYQREEFVGTGPRYTQMICPWDWDGNYGMPNLIGRDSHGDLWVFGPLVKMHRIGHGFTGYTIY